MPSTAALPGAVYEGTAPRPPLGRVPVSRAGWGRVLPPSAPALPRSRRRGRPATAPRLADDTGREPLESGHVPEGGVMAQPTVHLADVRLDAVDEADLRWLFCRAAGEMGERSSLGAMIDRLNEGRTHTGQSGTPDLPTSQYLAAAQRARSPPDWSTSASATPARSKPPTAPGCSPPVPRFAGLGSGDTCPTPWCSSPPPAPASPTPPSTAG